MKRGTISLQMDRMKLTASLVAMNTSIKRQTLVASGPSSKSVKPLPPTEPKKDYFLDAVVPAAHMELYENTMTLIATCMHAMRAVCSEYGTDFQWLPEQHVVETGDSLSETLTFFLRTGFITTYGKEQY